ncbi:hypothetical protein EBQ81_00705 [bacterium]|nr:hypothetical protein [bacterium]
MRGIAVLFILVGVFIATGLDKKIQTYLVEKDFLNIKLLEQKLVPESNSTSESSTPSETSKEKYNDAPELSSIATWINSNPLTISEFIGGYKK